jgi:hypothetical protein
MSMHMIQGVQVHGKSKKKLTPRDRAAAIEHEKWLKKMGVGKNKSQNQNKIPTYSNKDNKPKLSNKVAGNCPAKDKNVYTGNEIAGIVTTHKSNLMPVRRDNKQSAIDAANMRR